MKMYFIPLNECISLVYFCDFLVAIILFGFTHKNYNIQEVLIFPYLFSLLSFLLFSFLSPALFQKPYPTTGW